MIRAVRIAALGAAILALGAPLHAQGQALPYEADFRAVAGPRWKKRWAQAKQESSLNPRAVSWVGAKGLCQFMPKTWAWAISMEWIPAGADPFDPLAAMQAEDRYMSLEESFWASRGDGQWKAWASYNAGRGPILRAAKKARELGLTDSRGWLRALPAVTGPANAAQTGGYMPRIEKNILLTKDRP